ncbi:hypothetical protein BDN71DRAFT_1448861 [Pleurotus eryngii]|uniref:Uncharacterized protein n=1 Tax=Pleurotus eryngii TaxID=5323 RepID=A0A9P6DEV2_PLEER|nr:hypothetical protein BDN71DRAFT_1448861 [Pleurotus eryngii]
MTRGLSRNWFPKETPYSRETSSKLGCRELYLATIIMPVPQLPSEIIRQILELAAQSSTCLAICLVSSWARALATPYLFQTVKLKNYARMEHFMRTLIPLDPHARDTPSSSSIVSSSISSITKKALGAREPANFVRHLWVPVLSIHVFTLSRVCKNLTHIAMDQSTVVMLVSMSSMVPSPERYKDLHLFLFGLERLQYHIFLHPPPPNATTLRITHVQFAEPVAYTDESFNFIAFPFPRLTHMALPLHPSNSSTDDLVLLITLLLAAPKMEMLLLILYEDVIDEETAGRVVDTFRRYHPTIPGSFLLRMPRGDLELQWEREIHGAKSIWERGEEYTRDVLAAGVAKYGWPASTTT